MLTERRDVSAGPVKGKKSKRTLGRGGGGVGHRKTVKHLYSEMDQL